MTENKITENVDVAESVDVIIVGGGLAGLSMAAALSSLPINIIILEHARSPLHSKATQLSEAEYSPSFDDRALALSITSLNILSNVGVFSADDVKQCTPIEQIHVSDKGHLGMLRMLASELDMDALGRVIPAPLLGNKLSQYISNCDYQATISLLDHAQVNQIQHHANSASVQFSRNNEQTTQSKNQGKINIHTIKTQLLVLADGGRSGLAEQVGLPATITDYEQVSILANVKVNQSHHNIAYERFTESGPVALLPTRQNEFKLVWTVAPGQKEQLLNWSDDEFLEKLQNHFGFRAGKFEAVGSRLSYPMQSQVRSQLVSGRVALIGNAAHSLHPIAGQGFNLGLRDVACLAEIISELIQQGAQKDSAIKDIDFGATNVLFDYQQARQADVKLTSTFTDQLVKTFSNSVSPVAILRTLSLLAMDRQPRLKQKFMQKLMGVSGQQLRLAKGKL